MRQARETCEFQPRLGDRVRLYQNELMVFVGVSRSTTLHLTVPKIPTSNLRGEEFTSPHGSSVPWWGHPGGGSLRQGGQSHLVRRQREMDAGTQSLLPFHGLQGPSLEDGVAQF